MTEPQITREESDAINDRIRDAAGKNPGDLVLARDVHQFIASLDRKIDAAAALHKPVMFTWTQVDGTVIKEFGNYCEHCASLCHSSSGMNCDEPTDGAWPCATARALGLDQFPGQP